MASNQEQPFDQFIVHGSGPTINTYLMNPHTYDANKKWYVSLRKCTLQYSWKNIKAPNDAVLIDYGDGNLVDVTIPEGTWCLNTLSKYIKELIAENKQGAVTSLDFSITERDYNGTCKIKVGTNGLRFDTGTLGPTLGYPANLLITDNSSEPTGRTNLFPVTNLHVECNLVNSNNSFVSTNGVLIPKSVLKTAIVPSVCPYSTFELAGQCDAYSLPLGTYNINAVRVRFTTPEGDLLDFEGPSSATIIIASENLVFD